MKVGGNTLCLNSPDKTMSGIVGKKFVELLYRSLTCPDVIAISNLS